MTLDDEALRMAKRYAEGRSVSLGRAVSDLVLRGAKAPIPTKVLHGLVVFDPPADSPLVTTEMVRQLEIEE